MTVIGRGSVDNHADEQLSNRNRRHPSCCSAPNVPTVTLAAHWRALDAKQQPVSAASDRFATCTPKDQHTVPAHAPVAQAALGGELVDELMWLLRPRWRTPACRICESSTASSTTQHKAVRYHTVRERVATPCADGEQRSRRGDAHRYRCLQHAQPTLPDGPADR